ncbi:MAG: hypothetical protein LBU06_04775 [Desulfovibrio sp.]|jgi:hypothetical protein|nr:hypothetical protein [Desulfovibrio sp.]
MKDEKSRNAAAFRGITAIAAARPDFRGQIFFGVSALAAMIILLALRSL